MTEINFVNSDNVLDVLEQASASNETKLEKQCLQLIQVNTSQALASKTSKNVSQQTWVKILTLNKLNISELELFKIVLKWIDFQCERKNIEPTSENRRSIIGEAIYFFRFTEMSQAEFVEHVSRSGILTEKELVPIFEKFSGFDSPALKWTQPIRRKQHTIARFSRFPKSYELEIQLAAGIGPDRICISVSEEVSLLGVRLHGDNDRQSKYHVTFEVKEASVTGTFVSKLDKDHVPGFNVMLKEPVLLKENETVTLSAKISGPPRYRSKKGIPSVTHQGVTVTYSDADHPNNGTCIEKGQFYEVILEI